jgi:hypothetical protein
MDFQSTDQPGDIGPPRKRRALHQRLAIFIFCFLLAYLLIAYLFIPLAWNRYELRHPSLDDIPGITETGDHHPGDPLNVALIGTERELKEIMIKARWYPADPLTLKSCLEIAEASVLKRPYDEAPVSSLYLFGRKEDLAFEQPTGDDPRQRHHVRFWKTNKLDPDSRPLWIGSAVFDQHVGLSRTTGQITHVTAPDVDVERDFLFHDLAATGDLIETYVDIGFHKVLKGDNGGGDPWHTDGNLDVGVIAVEKKP